MVDINEFHLYLLEFTLLALEAPLSIETLLLQREAIDVVGELFTLHLQREHLALLIANLLKGFVDLLVLLVEVAFSRPTPQSVFVDLSEVLIHVLRGVHVLGHLAQGELHVLLLAPQLGVLLGEQELHAHLLGAQFPQLRIGGDLLLARHHDILEAIVLEAHELLALILELFLQFEFLFAHALNGTPQVEELFVLLLHLLGHDLLLVVLGAHVHDLGLHLLHLALELLNLVAFLLVAAAHLIVHFFYIPSIATYHATFGCGASRTPIN